ncbi:N-acetylmuramoyl-L-alanine amidase [Laceyella tengchongensis]
MNTPGKRTPPIPQLNGRVIKENEFNRAIVRYLDDELKRCGFKTLLVAPTDNDTPLATRTGLSNKKRADLYVSCHYNAGGGEVIETYHYKGSSAGR